MQVLPDTYQNMRQALGLGSDPYDPHDNIIAGTAFLAAMYNRFGYPGLFAAYDAGPERYDAWLQHGTPLPSETHAYLRAISFDVAESGLAIGGATGAGGFASTRVASSRPRNEPEFRSGRSLFFVFGNRTFAALKTPNQAAEGATQDANQPSIFVTLRRKSHPSPAPNMGTLFVLLSHRAE
jgi:Transglycosylase SLT domain